MSEELRRLAEASAWELYGIDKVTNTHVLVSDSVYHLPVIWERASIFQESRASVLCSNPPAEKQYEQVTSDALSALSICTDCQSAKRDILRQMYDAGDAVEPPDDDPGAGTIKTVGSTDAIPPAIAQNLQKSHSGNEQHTDATSQIKQRQTEAATDPSDVTELHWGTLDITTDYAYETIRQRCSIPFDPAGTWVCEYCDDTIAEYRHIAIDAQGMPFCSTECWVAWNTTLRVEAAVEAAAPVRNRLTGD